MNQVTRSPDSGRLQGFLVPLLLGAITLMSLSPAAAVGHEPSDSIIPRKSLVKVYLQRSFRGVVIKDRFVPEPVVQEVTEFNGVVVSSSGQIATYVGDYSLASDRDMSARVLAYDGAQYPARLLGLDSRISLLFLQSDFPENVAVGSSNKPDVEHFNVLTIGADGLRIGAPCVRSRKKQTWLPVHELSVSNLEPNPCCWTGAIAIDLEGNLIGIIADTTPHRFSKKLLEFQMLPSAVVGESLNGVLAGKKHVPAGWLGVTLDSQGARARVDHVYAGSPAHQAGILPGDVIVTLDDREVGFSDLVTAIRWKGPGASASFRVDRDGQARDIPVILGERATPKLAWTIQLSDSWADPETSLEKVRVFQAPLPPIIDLGFVVDRLPSQLARKLRSPEPGGLLVKEIRQDSAAEKAGFQAGDILFRINGYSVFTFSDVRKSIDASRNGVVEIRFVRDGEVLYKAISLQ